VDKEEKDVPGLDLGFESDRDEVEDDSVGVIDDGNLCMAVEVAKPSTVLLSDMPWPPWSWRDCAAEAEPDRDAP